jgi:hypothetical protein
MPLWGRKASDTRGQESPGVGLGPDYHAPETTSPAGTYKPPIIHDARSGMPVQTQWGMYNKGRDVYPPDTERIERSRREEKYIYNASGLVDDESRKVVRPDESYYNPPPNPRNVRRPSTVSFTRDPYSHGYADRLNEDHFSMASNMRAYEIYGQGPNYVRRINTLRAEPAPMDINTYDTSAETRPAYGVFESSESSPYSRSFRL